MPGNQGRNLEKRTPAQLRSIIATMATNGGVIPDPVAGPIVEISRGNPTAIADAATALETAVASAVTALNAAWKVRQRAGGPLVAHPEIAEFEATVAEFIQQVRGT